MWSNGVGAVCILVTRVVSFTLVNVYEIIDKKNWDFKIIPKITVHKPLPCLRVQAMAVFNLLLDCGEREIVVPGENELSLQKSYHLTTFSRVTVSPILKN